MSYKSPRFIDEHINDLIQRIRKVERRRAGGLTLTGGSTAGGVVYVGSDGNLTTDADCFFYDEDTDQLLLCDGSVSEPSYSFVSSPTTGIYSPAVNQLGFTTNGVGRVVLDDDGQVGWPTITAAQGFSWNPTLTNSGTTYHAFTIDALLPNTATSAATALAVRNRMGTGASTDMHGVYVLPGTKVSGSLTRAFGIFIEAQAAGTANYGMAIHAQTAGSALWLGSNVSATNVTGGIYFGDLRDTTLFRSGSGQLSTGGSFSATAINASGNGSTFGQTTFTRADAAAIIVRSGSAASSTWIDIGRTAVQYQIAVTQAAGNFLTDSAVGDVLFVSVQPTRWGVSGGATLMRISSAVNLHFAESAGAMIGVFGATPVVRQVVSGVRHGNPALASFLTGLATLGWITDSTTVGSSPILESFMAAKGDLITATANDTPIILGVGTDGFILTANSGVANGIEWAAPASGGHTIEEDGTPLTARTGLNFVDGLIATDDAGNDETDINADWATTEIVDIGTVESAGVSTKIPRADHVHVHPSIGSGDLHPEYATDTDLSTHAAAADPHTGYRLESADHSHATTGLQGGTVSHDILTDVSEDDHHNRLHTVTDVADHTFPGGTTTFLRADGTFATPPGGSGGGDTLVAWIGL